MPETDSFPRQYARTRRFTLGEPRNVVVSPDGQRVVFIRSRAGDDPVNCLWVLDLGTGEERLVADPLASARAGRPRRRAAPRNERAASGCARAPSASPPSPPTGPSPSSPFRSPDGCSSPGCSAAWRASSIVDGPVFDPRPDPGGPPSGLRQRQRPAHRRTRRQQLGARQRRRPGRDLGQPPTSSPPRNRRYRGYWWSPDGTAIAACRVDVSPVASMVHRAIRRSPTQQPREVRYPAAGTANADVGLHVLALDGGSIEVAWDHERYPYLAAVQLGVRRAAAAHRPVPRPTRHPGAGGQPDDRRHRTDLRRSRRLLGRAGARNPGRARRRAVGHDRRSRRRPPPAGRRRRRDSDRPAGARRRGRSRWNR